MIDYTLYNLNSEDLDFLKMLYADVENQNEIYLLFGDKSFVLEPSGEEIKIYAYGETLGYFDTLDDALLNFKFCDKTFIELIPHLDFA